MSRSKTTVVNVIVPLKIVHDDDKALREGLKSALDDLYFEVWSSAGYYVRSGKPKKVQS